MDWLWGLIGNLIIGGAAGWLASSIMRGGGFGMIGNIVLGIVGAWVAQFLLGWLMPGIFGAGWIGSLIAGVIGAIIILAIVGLFKKS